MDHWKTHEAVERANQYFVSKSGRKKLRQTTKGWDLCVLSKNGEEQWIPLRELEDSNPVEVADYTVANRLQDEPAFKWWVPYIIRKHDNIISKLSARVTKGTHKYGVRIPRSIKRSL